MSPSRRQILHRAGAASLLASSPFVSRAQGAMLEQVKIVTGFPPGGTSDTICRRVAAHMQGSYGKSVVVENRTGAGGQIAISAVKGMPADGTAILQTPMSMLGIYPHIYKKLPYDPVADLTPASLGAVFDFGFAVGPAVPDTVRTMAQFLAWAKANPDKANFGSPASGSTPHFIGVLAGRTAGIELKHVPYRGTQPAILDMIGGQVQAVSGPVGEFTQHVAAGKCRLLATTGAARSKFAPGVPTMVEQGMKDMPSTSGSASICRPRRRRTSSSARTPRARRAGRARDSRGTGADGPGGEVVLAGRTGRDAARRQRPLGAADQVDRLHRRELKPGTQCAAGEAAGRSWARHYKPG
jgi:tripartite-type tricarboxylate transporter receptor subunit TctC